MIKKISSRIVYENKWMKVREDEVEFADGKKGIYGVVDKPDGALIIPKLNDDTYVLVKTYRYTTGKRLWEFPCGGIEGTKLKHEDIAHRELQEETGYSAKHMTHLASLNIASGYANHVIHMYLAEGLTPGESKPDQGEIGIEMKPFTTKAIETMMIRGEITDADSIAAWGIMKMKEKKQ